MHIVTSKMDNILLEFRLSRSFVAIECDVLHRSSKWKPSMANTVCDPRVKTDPCIRITRVMFVIVSRVIIAISTLKHTGHHAWGTTHVWSCSWTVLYIHITILTSVLYKVVKSSSWIQSVVGRMLCSSIISYVHCYIIYYLYLQSYRLYPY